MLNLSELEQFVTFAEQGTLSGAAQTHSYIQPTLTQHYETCGSSLWCPAVPPQ